MYNRVILSDLSQARALVRQFLDRLKSQFIDLDKYVSKKSPNPDPLPLSSQHGKEYSMVDLNRHYSCEASVFLNKQKFFYNPHAVDQKHFLHSYRSAQWSDAIFSTPSFIDAAIPLFLAGKLHQTEFETLLQWHRALVSTGTPTQLNHLNFFKILNESGEFTEKASRFILKNLNGYMYKPFDLNNKIAIRNIQLLTQAFFELFPSENIFCTMKTNQMKNDKFSAIFSVLHLSSVIYDGLDRSNFRNNKDKAHREQYFASVIASPQTRVVLPCAFEDALLLANFPLEDVVPVRSTVGNVTTRDLGRWVQAGLQPGSTTLENTSTLLFVHKMMAFPNAAFDHDRYHAMLRSRQGKMIRLVLLRIAHLARVHMFADCQKFTGKCIDELYSKVVLALIDGELSYFNNSELFSEFISDETKVALLCAALDFTAKRGKDDDARTAFLFEIEGNQTTLEPTDLGIIVFVDMVLNRDIWLGMECNPDHLVSKYERHFQMANELKKYFSNDAKNNTLIFRTYLHLLMTSSAYARDYHIEAFFLWFKENANHLRDQFEFKRDNRIAFLGLIHVDVKLPISESIFFALVNSAFNLDLKLSDIHPNFSLSEHINVIHHAWLLGIYFSRYKLASPRFLELLKIGLDRLFVGNRVDFSEFLELTSASVPVRELRKAYSVQFFQSPLPVLASIHNFFCDALKHPLSTVKRNAIVF